MKKESKNNHSDVKQCTGWVVYLDIYGFKNMVVTHDLALLSERLFEAAEKFVAKLHGKHNQPIIYTLSDSIFLLFPDKKAVPLQNRLQQSIEHTQTILGIYAEQGLPLRGGMSYGEVYHGLKVLFGPAVISAVANEQLVSAPLVVLPAKNIPESIHLSGLDIYPIRPSGVLKLKLIFPVPVDSYCRLVKENYDMYIIDGPGNVAEAWYKALEFVNDALKRRAK